MPASRYIIITTPELLQRLDDAQLPDDERIQWIGEDQVTGVPEGSEAVLLHPDYNRLAGSAQHVWRLVWYNAQFKLAPGGMPVHDADLSTLDEVRDVPDLLVSKPTLTQVLAWWDAWGLPGNIRRHVSAVAGAAYALGVQLKGAGQPIDPILAHRGGLLHDLDKLHTLEPEADHGGVSAEFLREQGYPRLAEIVSGHVLTTALQPGTNNRTWEDKLVFFCDKLAEEDQIVPFDERLAALKLRYPKFRPVMEQAEPAVWAISDEICTHLSIPNHRKLIDWLKKLQYN